MSIDKETFFGATAFAGALILGLSTHYIDLVKTHVGGYPEQWFPSVSAVIGDHYPARSFIQFFIALAAVSRFPNISARRLQYKDKSYFLDLIRTVSIGGSIYITSNDNMFLHSASMVVYLCSTLGYMILDSRRCLSAEVKDVKMRITQLFFLCTLVMSKFLYEHQILGKEAAYSYYGLFEWCLIPLDILFTWSDSFCQKPERLDVVDQLKLSWKPYLLDLYYALLFWTNVTVLPSVLWYFPLWNMGPSGYEAILFAYLAPAFLLKLSGKTMDGVMRSLSGLFLIVGRVTNLKTRLLLVGLGTACSMTVGFKKIPGRTLMVGLLLHVAIKLANNSINPLWTTVPKDVGTVVFLSALHMFTVGAAYFSSPIDSMFSESRVTRSIPITRSISIGATLFSIHSFLTDAESVPLRFRSASESMEYLVLFSMAFGIVFSGSLLSRHRFLQFSLPFSIFVSEFAAFKCALSTRSLQIINGVDTKGMFHALLTYILLLLADVWTVAYAFVPGGGLLREKSFFIFILAQILQVLPSEDRRTVVSALSDYRYKVCNKMVVLLILSISAVFGAMQYNLSSHQQELVHFNDKNVLTTGIWTLHFGLDGNMMYSHKAMTDIIEKLDLDVVGILESDTMRTIGGNRNMLKYTARKLNMNIAYGPPPNDNTWGCAMLSKWPIVNSTSYLLPSPNGELACAVKSTIKIAVPLPGKMTMYRHVDILVSHNGQEEDYVDRILQTTEIAKIVAESINPVVFLGYLVTKPGKGREIYDIMTEKGGLVDIFEEDKNRWCQYIFYKNLKALAYARVSHGGITDTEIQSAKFWVGPYANITGLTEKSSYPKELLNRHRYHVYKEPVLLA